VSCRETLHLLEAYVDGELGPEAALSVERHLRTCRRCSAEERALRALGATLRRHALPSTAPERAQARLRVRCAALIEPPREGLLHRHLPALPGVVALLLVALLAAAPARDVGQPGSSALVVYHISQAQTASGALRNLHNHLEAAPGIQVVVVAHNSGIDFLLRDARDETGALYEPAVRGLKSRGVEFRLCENTLARREIGRDRVIGEAVLVPSGVAEVIRLQSEEGYAYMKL
jgi:uncharacterized protein